MGYNRRYIERKSHKGYEVVDLLNDEVVCYGPMSEHIDEVVRAMNAQHKKDNA